MPLDPPTPHSYQPSQQPKSPPNDEESPMLYPVFRHLNEILVRWAMRKYKRLRRHKTRAIRFLADVARRQPGLFAHWRFGVRPDGWTMGAV